MADYSYGQVEAALRRLGRKRVLRAQKIAWGHRVGGRLLLCVGLRETGLRNIEGGAKKDASGKWVPEDDPARMDVGWLQISRRWRSEALLQMPAVRVGTWSPLVEGATGMTPGHVPTFRDALIHVDDAMRQAVRHGEGNGVAEKDLVRFALASHNAGLGGALSGYRAGNVDRDTTGGDYSAWVLAHKPHVTRFLTENPEWSYTGG